MSDKLLTFLSYLIALPRSLLFNLRYLPVRQALRIPVLIHPRVKLKRCKGELIVPDHVKTGGIRIGFGNVEAFDRRASRTIWQVEGRVEFRGKAKLGHGSKLIVKGQLLLGKNFNISAESTIICYEKISFGDDCLLSWDILVMDHDYHVLTDSDGTQINAPTPVHVGERSWIGCRCTLLKGSELPSGTVVAAGTTLSGSLSQGGAVYGGTPPRLLRENIGWHH